MLRATLQGHPVGHDLDVTEALRARLRARGNARLSIAVSENLRAELFGDASSIGVTTAGTAGALEADAPAELRRLLREPAAAPYNLGKQTR